MIIKTGYCRRICTCLTLVAVLVLRPAVAGDDVETSGDVLRVALPVAALALTYRHDDDMGRWQFARAFAANVTATWLLKETIDAERPDGSGDDAFPSGHASMAFQGAAFIHRRYGMDSAWPAYALAAYTGWTRLDSDRHDEFDVIAGAALGVAASFLFANEQRDLSVALLDGGIGLEFRGRF